MLENKRERLKTFLRKIDEKAIVKLKRFMKESYPAESAAGGLKKSRSSCSNGSVRKVESRKTCSLEAQQELQHQAAPRQEALRAQTVDDDFRGFERTEAPGSQSSFIKHNKTFHKLFPNIPLGEDLIHAYICALQKEVPYHGRLYVTDTHACFYSSVLLKDTKVVIPVSCIRMVKKQNTALLVPNALSIRTAGGDKYLLVSLRNRESCYQLLRSVSPRLQDGSTNSSPVFSSADNSFEKSRLVNSSQSSLDDGFDRLDGSESRSSKDRPERHTEAEPEGNGPAFRSLHLQPRDGSSSEELSVTGSCGSWVCSVTEKAKALLVQRESSTLNTLLAVYLILVLLLLLSSGYIGLRIVALEEQLTSLGALSEFTLQRGYQDT